MMRSFIFLIKLRVVWEMLIQSSVRSGRNLLQFALGRNPEDCHLFPWENETIYQGPKHCPGNLEG